MVLQPQYKRFAVLVGFFVLLIGVFMAVRYFVLNKKPKELTQEQKIEIVNQLNIDAKNAPIVTEKEKEEIIKTINTNSPSKELSPEEKKAIVDSIIKK
jgi:Na+-translocating ferredoxin:NAD+ oxidoreductase RnfG subunit